MGEFVSSEEPVTGRLPSMYSMMRLRGAVGVTPKAKETMKIEPTSCRLALVITITLGALPSGALAQSVSNGGFEIPLVAPGSAIYTAGQSFGGWTVDSGSVSLNGECPPFSGLQSASLSSSSTTVHQDLNTIVGAQYTICYARACGNGCGCDAVGHGVFVAWGAETVFDYWTGGWAHKSYTFVATDVTTRLSFSSYKDISLDDVSVVPSYPLMIRRLDNTRVRVSWSTNAAGYMLEYAAALHALTWIPATNAPDIIGQDFVISFNASSRQQFFRLRKQ